MAAEATLSTPPTLTSLRAEMQDELVTRILPYWMHEALDERNGGFAGLILDDGSVLADAPKGSILNARILWTFSAAFRALGGTELRATADRAASYLSAHFLDPVHGGVYWMVDATGKPTDDRKHVYAQAFAIYALAEHYRATGDEASLVRAIDIFQLIETHGHDLVFGGYEEAFSRDWFVLADARLSAEDVDASKSMNTHLHLLEAYTTLFRVWPDPLLRTRLEQLAELFVTTIVGEDQHAHQFFDGDWTPVGGNSMVSYGHDIEASWLLLAAADALESPDLRDRVKDVATRLAASALDEGMDAEQGGLFNGTDAAGVLDTDKEWWPQAEAIVGFLNAFIETGDDAYLDATHATWAFTRRFVRDLEHGEWHRRVSRDGRVRAGREKVGPWKCPYHNARACLEVIARIDARGTA
ncbi:MAG: AGE family epimerase/isomerase [bacterium]